MSVVWEKLDTMSIQGESVQEESNRATVRDGHYFSVSSSERCWCWFLKEAFPIVLKVLKKQARILGDYEQVHFRRNDGRLVFC